MPPQIPYLVIGKIYTSRGTVLNSRVTVNSDLSGVTDESGTYLLDLANLNNGYTSGASYTITAKDEFNNEYVSDTITVTGGGQTKDLYLSSRTRSTEIGQNNDREPVLMRTIGNNPVTRDNLLPVQTLERPTTQVLAYVLGTSKVEYIGDASPGTPTSSAKWRIKKLTYLGNNVTATTWAKGNALFDKVWDNMTTYTYS